MNSGAMFGSLRLAAALVAAVLCAGAAPAPRILPTEWALAPFDGPKAVTGTFPESALLTADGKHVVVVDAGAGKPGVAIFAAATLAPERTIALQDAFGAPLADAAGAGFWLGTGGRDTLVHADAASGSIDRTIALPKGFWPASIARSPDGKALAVSGDLANAVVFIDAASGAASAPVPVGPHPAGVAYAGAGTLFVADWGAAALSAIDVKTRRVRATIPVGLHPEALLLSRDGTRLFVAEPDDDAIGVVDVAAERRAGGVNVGIYGDKVFGASPNALALSGDGRRLFVTCGAANAIAVIDVSEPAPRVLGALPAGWYPTALAPDGNGGLFVADGMGEGGRANPQFRPFAPRGESGGGYVATSMTGSLRRIALPDEAALQSGLAAVRAARPSPAAAPHDTVVRADGPLRHVIYVIKENRSFDQVLGDVPGADGDASLTLFGERITPNQHALARRFGVLDNTFADAEVSADGHNWSTAAFANDYTERMWPPVYGGRRDLYDFQDGAKAAVPHSGYLWDALARAGLSLRNYGEATTETDGKPGASTTAFATLAPNTDPAFTGFDVAVRDEAREAEWAREFAAYERAGTLPALEIVDLPNDHTAGTRPGRRTPTAYVAENDLAVGRLVDAVSHSRDWAHTAVLIVEDDAQNGADHVDAQRMTAYVASPYAKGGVVHARYSTAGILRTIELILGVPPMSAYDAVARPLYDAFGASPDTRPYDALPETADLEARNAATAYRAAESARLDFSREDAAPPALLNDIVWHAVRGGAAR
jgi:YVTN family beta-propeller protein